MLELNVGANMKTENKQNFWAGIDQKVVRAFASENYNASYSAFKIYFDALLVSNIKKARQVFNEFDLFYKNKTPYYEKVFKMQALKLLGVQQQGKVKVNLIKVKNKYNKPKIKENCDGREL